MYNISKTCQIENLNNIYLKYFGYPSSGYFVEIGAYDGETFSNTSCLADIGWSGIYIEPVESHYKKCKERHKNNSNIKVFQYLIGAKECEQNLYVGKEDVISWGGAISTSNEKHLEIYKQNPSFSGINYNQLKVSQIRFDKLLFENEIKPNFDLLVVDVEGSEFDVYDSFDLNYWKPKMMIVEIEEDHVCFNKYYDYLENCSKLRKKFYDNGYMVIHRDPTNTVFLLDETK